MLFEKNIENISWNRVKAILFNDKLAQKNEWL